MEHLWMPDIGIGEKILRSVVVYLFLLIISNVVQNAIIGADNSLGGGLIGAAAILLLNWAVVEYTYRHRKTRHWLGGGPTILVHDGKIIRDHMVRERITHEELEAALREHGVGEVEKVRFAVLEETGKISVIPREKGPA